MTDEPEKAVKLHKHNSAAFTLPETMVASTVFVFVVLAVVYLNIYGLKLYQVANSKSGASDIARQTFTKLFEEIRCAKGWQVGSGTLTTFTPCAAGVPQTGNAIRLFPTTTSQFVIDTNNYMVYYVVANSGTLQRRTSTTSSKQIANWLTNTVSFTVETPRGDIQTDLSYKGVIHVQMFFAQYLYPLTKIGSGYLYDSYQLNFRVASHAPDGP